MSTSNPKSNSSASKRKATKRYDATRAGKKAAKSAAKATKISKPSSKASTSRGAKKRGLTSAGSASNKASSRLSIKPQANSKPSLNLVGGGKSKPSSAPSAVATRRAATGAVAAKSGGEKPQSLKDRIPANAGRGVFVGAIVVAVLALIFAVLLLVLSHLPVFVIEGIDAQASEHVSAEAIAKLAGIEEGTTLLSLDVDQVSANIKQNPWIKEVTLTREFPANLGITVEERQIGAVVVIGAGSSVWAIGTDGVWIEPVTLDTSTQDITSAALAYAQEIGCLFISDVPATVNPAQGSPTTDSSILAVLTFQEELPDDISSQARVYYASSEAAVSLVLDSGLEISLGSPEDINAKSQALSEIMATYPNQLTYINVRVPSKPTYRKVPDGTTVASVGEVVAANVAETAATTDSSSDDTSDTSEDDTSDSSDDYSEDDASYDDSSYDSGEDSE